jgi:preprotein translocase subunit YajC
LIDIVYAMGPSGGGTGQAASSFSPLIPMLLMFVIFYFLLIRPQQKKNKEHRQMIENLKKGDRIITSGGLHGRITGLNDAILTVEISEKVRVKISRSSIAGLVQSTTQAPAAKKEKSDSKTSKS